MVLLAFYFPSVTGEFIQGRYINKNCGHRNQDEIVADITSSYMVLLAIYFPSVTGEFIQGR